MIDPFELKGRKLGEILLLSGVIDQPALEDALVHASVWAIPLGEALVELDFASEDAVLHGLAIQLAAPVVALHGRSVPKEVLEMLPARTAAVHRVIPIGLSGEDKGTLLVAIDLPRNAPGLKELAFLTGRGISAAMAKSGEIDDALVSLYKIDPTLGL